MLPIAQKLQNHDSRTLNRVSFKHGIRNNIWHLYLRRISLRNLFIVKQRRRTTGHARRRCMKTETGSLSTPKLDMYDIYPPPHRMMFSGYAFLSDKRRPQSPQPYPLTDPPANTKMRDRSLQVSILSFRGPLLVDWKMTNRQMSFPAMP